MRFFYITKSMDAGDTAINPKNQAIYKKGEEILQLIKQIGDLIPEDNKHLHFINGQIFADAGIVSAEVAGFNQWNYIIYRWGLFNRPGDGTHDKDPDDDIPFNPDDFPE